MEKRHLYLGSGVLVLLVASTVALVFGTSQAQMDTTPPIPGYLIEARVNNAAGSYIGAPYGSNTSFEVKLTSVGTPDPVNPGYKDNVTIELLDTSLATSAPASWCYFSPANVQVTVKPGELDSSVTVQGSCTPTVSLENKTYSFLIRTISSTLQTKGWHPYNSIPFNITVSGVPVPVTTPPPTAGTACPSGQAWCAPIPPSTVGYCAATCALPPSTGLTCSSGQVRCASPVTNGPACYAGSTMADCPSANCPSPGVWMPDTASGFTNAYYCSGAPSTTPGSCPSGQIWCAPTATTPGGAGYCAATCPSTTPPPTDVSCPSGQIRCYGSAGGTGWCQNSPCPPSTPPTPPPSPETLPDCGPGEGFYTPSGQMGMTCKIPNWKWDSTVKSWVKATSQECGYGATTYVPVGQFGPTCTSFHVEELEYKNQWARKWDPVQYGSHYWPSYPEGTPWKKYDAKTDALAACNPNEPTSMSIMPYTGDTCGSPEYYSSCQRIASTDEQLWLARFRAEKKMHDLYIAACYKAKGQPPLPPPPPEMCLMVITRAYNSATKECTDFPNSCLPPGWVKSKCQITKPFPPEQCPIFFKGCGPNEKPIMNPDGCFSGKCIPEEQMPPEKPRPPLPPPLPPRDCKMWLRGMRDGIRGDKFFLRDIKRLLKEAPADAVGKKELEALYAKGIEILSKAEAFVKAGKCVGDEQIAIDELLNEFRMDIMPEINDLRQVLEGYRECGFLQKDLKRKIKELTMTLKDFRGDKKSFGKLSEFKAEFENLLEQAGKAVKSGEDGFICQDLRMDWQDIEENLREFFEEQHERGRNRFIIDTIQNIRSWLDRGTACTDTGELVNQVRNLLDESEKLYRNENFEEAIETLDKAKPFEEPIQQIFDKCGIEGRGFEVRPVMIGAPEEIVNRIIEKVFEKVSTKLQTLLDERITALATKVADLQHVSVEKIGQSLANLQVIADEQSKKIAVLKEELALKAKEIEESIVKANLRKADRARVFSLITDALQYNWCGNLGENIKVKLNALASAVESGDVHTEDIAVVEQVIADAKPKNALSCYDTGVSKFKDTLSEAWYFAHTQDQTFFKGKYDETGRPLYEFEPGRKALRMEVIAALLRALNYPGADGSCALTAPVSGASEWANCSLNIASNKGVKFDGPVNQPVTRKEVAYYIFVLAGDKLPVKIDDDVGSILKRDFGDVFGYVEKDFEKPIVYVSATGIMKGDESKFRPNDAVVRAELAAIMARLVPFVSGAR